MVPAEVAFAIVVVGCADRPLSLPESSGGAEDLALADLSVIHDLSFANDLSMSPDIADLASGCEALDEASCRRHRECVADYCVECSCTPSFVGCRPPWAPKTSCPAIPCNQPACCGSSAACNPSPDTPMMECVAPGEFPGCGTCYDGLACQSDSDCAGDAGLSPPYFGTTCDFASLHFQCGGCHAAKICVVGCVQDPDCVGGRTCDATGHCVWSSCTSDADCAVDFFCSSGLCQRAACTNDGDCASGFCVNGQCYPAYGTCRPTPV